MSITIYIHLKSKRLCLFPNGNWFVNKRNNSAELTLLEHDRSPWLDHLQQRTELYRLLCSPVSHLNIFETPILIIQILDQVIWSSLVVDEHLFNLLRQNLIEPNQSRGFHVRLQDNALLTHQELTTLVSRCLKRNLKLPFGFRLAVQVIREQSDLEMLLAKFASRFIGVCWLGAQVQVSQLPLLWSPVAHSITARLWTLQTPALLEGLVVGARVGCVAAVGCQRVDEEAVCGLVARWRGGMRPCGYMSIWIWRF